MAGDLAAEGRVLLAHPRLEEGVADAREVGAPALGGDQVGHGAAGARVVEDRRAGVLRQRRPGEQGADEVAVAELAAAVDEEAAVGVAVPGDAEVGAGAAHALHDHRPVLRQQRVGLVVGELAVGLEVHLLQIEAEPVQGRPDHRPRHAVAAVDDHLHRLHLGGIDEREGMGAELVPDVDLLEGAAAGRVPKAGLDLLPDVADPGVAGERQRALADQLHPGVGLRVVRSGDHRAAVQLARADQVVEHLGRDHPGVEHGRALEDQPVAQLRRHRRCGQSHVAAEPDPQLARLLAAQSRQHPGEGAADRVRGRLVHLLAVQPADVVGLEDPGRGKDRLLAQNAPFSAS